MVENRVCVCEHEQERDRRAGERKGERQTDKQTEREEGEKKTKERGYYYYNSLSL